MARNPRDPFNAPIPGESLTRPPGGAPYEKPPQFADPRMAAEFVWSKMTQPRNVAMLKATMNKGATAESIANTVLREGFNTGKWTPDTAIMMSKPVLAMVTAVGKKAGVKNLKVMEEDHELQDFLIDNDSLDDDVGFEADITGPLEELPEEEPIEFKGPLGGGN